MECPVPLVWGLRLEELAVETGLKTEPAEAFRLVEPLSPYRTGRAAHVSDLSGVSSREDVLRIVGEMAADLEGGGAAA